MCFVLFNSAHQKKKKKTDDCDDNAAAAAARKDAPTAKTTTTTQGACDFVMDGVSNVIITGAASQRRKKDG